MSSVTRVFFNIFLETEKVLKQSLCLIHKQHDKSVDIF